MPYHLSCSMLKGFLHDGILFHRFSVSSTLFLTEFSSIFLLCFFILHVMQGHGHWVNSLALSTEYVLRTGAFDHNCKQFSSPEEMKKVIACPLTFSVPRRCYIDLFSFLIVE